MTTAQDKLHWRLLGQIAKHHKAVDLEFDRKQFYTDHHLPASHKTWTNKHYDQFLSAANAILKPADLQAQLRAHIQATARKRHKVTMMLPLLSVLGVENPGGYLITILNDRFKGQALYSISDAPRPGRHRSSDLDRLIFTMAGNIDRKRREQNLTVHQLYTAAQQKCPHPCKQCAGAPLPEPQPEPADGIQLVQVGRAVPSAPF